MAAIKTHMKVVLEFSVLAVGLLSLSGRQEASQA